MSNKIIGIPYVLQKHGMYYAHNNAGYVSRCLLAEIYTEAYAKDYASKSEEVLAIPISLLLTSSKEVSEYISRLEVMRDALREIGQ